LLRLILLAWLLAGTAVWAQSMSVPATARQFTSNAHGWFMYFGDHPVKAGSKWGIHLEGQWRRHDVVSRWQQLLLRPALNYEVNRNLVLTGGYGLITTHRYGAFPTAAPFPEHRLFQQALVRQAIGKWSLSHRYRLEQRFLGEKRVLADGRRELVRWRHENRFRYMFRLMRPIHGPWGVALYDEFFLNFGRNVAANVFDQNRAYAALTHSLGKASRIEVGYLNQIVQQRNGRIFENNHTVQVAIYSTLPLRR
jgi:hypothetical protein